MQTQRIVRVYDLSKQELIKKLQSNSKWVSTMAIHPGKIILLLCKKCSFSRKIHYYYSPGFYSLLICYYKTHGNESMNVSKEVCEQIIQ